ncbi:MAG: GNAT family N-acetyltransferase [Calditrichota bacterium]
MTTIRQTTSSDWQAVKALRLQALADAPYAFAETLAEAEATPDTVWQERIQQNSEGKNSICALAIEEDHPVGMAVGLNNSQGDGKAHLVAMWVASEQRGSGAAEALVEFIVSWARDVGAAVLQAGVMESNQRALAFYRRVGFELMSNYHTPRQTSIGHEVVLEMKI